MGYGWAPGAVRPLTKQERTVLYCLNFEFTNPEIAFAMDLAKNTVKVHKSNLYKKLGLLGLGKAAAQRELQAFCIENPDLIDLEADANHQ